MRIIFLTHFYPRSKRSFYFDNSRTGLSAAADAHQYALALGLNEVCKDLEIVNLPAVSHFPIRYKSISNKEELIKENGLSIHNVGYNNLFEYQHVSRTINAKKILDEKIKNTEVPIHLLVYGINFAILKAAVDIKNKYPENVLLSIIIPDLPEHVNTHGHLVSNLLDKIRSIYFKSSEEYFNCFDSFILLSEPMSEIVGCKGKKNYIVSEGVYDESLTPRLPHSEPDNFTVFYGGMMHRKFGVMNLVDAFHAIPNQNFRLQLCGYGDSIEDIKNLASHDSRIQYLGILPRDKVLEFQSKASLLVNPRIPDNNPFTKYSFPSKTLEYFASATPSLIYQLEGIPKIYYDYCFSLDSNHTDSNSLAQEIIRISKLPVEERLKVGMDARNFVLKNKNPLTAATDIINLLASIQH